MKQDYKGLKQSSWPPEAATFNKSYRVKGLDGKINTPLKKWAKK